MTQMIDPSPASRSLLDMVERASLFALLQQALEHQKRPQELPGRLYDDLGLPPSSGCSPLDHLGDRFRTSP